MLNEHRVVPPLLRMELRATAPRVPRQLEGCCTEGGLVVLRGATQHPSLTDSVIMREEWMDRYRYRYR